MVPGKLFSNYKNIKPMITRIKNSPFPYFFGLMTVIFLISCKKDVSSTAADSSSTIAVAASESAAVSPSGTTDSVYIVQPCNRNQIRTTVNETDLPAAVTTYLTANYSGYSFVKAFAVVNNSGATDAYVVVVYYNDKPVG